MVLTIVLATKKLQLFYMIPCDSEEKRERGIKPQSLFIRIEK